MKIANKEKEQGCIRSTVRRASCVVWDSATWPARAHVLPPRRNHQLEWTADSELHPTVLQESGLRAEWRHRRRRRRSLLCGLLWVVSRFKPAEAYAEGTRCACVLVHVLVCQGHARAGLPRHARLGYSATERMQMCWRRAGAGDARKIWSAALQSDQGCRCRAVVCCACVCGLLREAASWPDGHLSCQSVRALLWIVFSSVVRWVPW